MKKISVALLLAGITFSAQQSQAFMIELNLDCTPLHVAGSNFPIPDMPNYSLECQYGAGFSNCKLISVGGLAGLHQEFTMTKVSENNEVARFQAQGLTATVDFNNRTGALMQGVDLGATCSAEQLQ